MRKQKHTNIVLEGVPIAASFTGTEKIINELLGGIATAHSMALQAADGKVSPDSFILSIGTVLETIHNRALADLRSQPAINSSPLEEPALMASPRLDLFSSPANSEFFDALVRAHAACVEVQKERIGAGVDATGHFALASALGIAIKNVYESEIRLTDPRTQKGM